jgi:hypothetical protein
MPLNAYSDIPEPGDDRKALVEGFLKEIELDLAHHEPAFKRMREDTAFTRGIQWAVGDRESYRINLVLRHVMIRTAALYAKNPTFIAERSKREEFQFWQGSLEEIQMLQQGAMMGNVAMLPAAQAMLADIQMGVARRKAIDGVGRSLQGLFAHYMQEDKPVFKVRAKQMVRRAVICGVGYVRPGFRRELDYTPDVQDEIVDLTETIASIERVQREMAAGDIVAPSGEIEKMRLSLSALQSRREVVTREGLVFSFPKAWNVIPDRHCTSLIGFQGARWVTERIPMTPEQIREIFKVDIGRAGEGYTGYTIRPDGQWQASLDAKSVACVYQIYDRASRLRYTIASGYWDLLEPPQPMIAPSDWAFPIFSFAPNEVEGEAEVPGGIYPESDVRLLRHPQMEFNRMRRTLREHRIANAPQYAAVAGLLESEDKTKLRQNEEHALVEIKALDQGQKIGDVIQQIPKHPIDPQQYDVSSVMMDIQSIAGEQPANYGRPTGVSATESTIAENSRISTLDSAKDDLDEMLSEVARFSGMVLLSEMTADKVKEILGPGAVWPEWSASELAGEIYLTIKAGSSGRPNKAIEIANFERLTPLLIQIPGISPQWLAEKAVRMLDDTVDLKEAIIAALPSIITANRLLQPPTGDPATSPEAQGGEGGDKTPGAQTRPGGPQPAMPASTPGAIPGLGV